MNVLTKYDIGSRVEVLIDGVIHKLTIDEIRMLAFAGTGNQPVVTYRGYGKRMMKKADGSDYESSREWIGKEEDIIGDHKHESIHQPDTAQTDAQPDTEERIPF